ncbi:MAG: hypothetical protein HYX94_03515 [Chloroflexi bacterium]|nr:hypothetical protein [Chloroflexota bacterium]
MLAMKFKWTTTLNTDLASMKKFALAGIQPISRPFFRAHQHWGDDGLVVENMLDAGVGPYIQIYNEPESASEWGGSVVDKNGFIRRWISAAESVYARGGFPGIQLFEPDWLSDLLNAIKSVDKDYLFDRLWFCCHNYGSNHPPAYPYDKLNRGKTIYQDWFSMLAPLKFDRVFRDTIGHSVPIICTEGGWCIGDNSDTRYPRVDYQRHRDYHLAMFDMFRTGIMPNGYPLPDWWFAVTPRLLASRIVGGDIQFEESAWFSNALSGTKTLTIESVTKMPSFVRQFAG